MFTCCLWICTSDDALWKSFITSMLNFIYFMFCMWYYYYSESSLHKQSNVKALRIVKHTFSTLNRVTFHAPLKIVDSLITAWELLLQFLWHFYYFKLNRKQMKKPNNNNNNSLHLSSLFGLISIFENGLIAQAINLRRCR